MSDLVITISPEQTTSVVVGIQGPPGVAGDKGDQGVPGASLPYIGIYNSATQYAVNDLVSFGGSTWISLTGSLGIEPTDGTDWSVFVAKGDTGATGPQGPQGIKGDAGATGPAGLDASITTADIQSITSAVLLSITADSIGALTTADIIQFITTDQANAITTAAISAITAESLHALTTADVTQFITSTQASEITSTQVAAITPVSIHALSTADIVGLINSTQASAITTAQIAAITTAQLPMFQPTLQSGVNIKQINGQNLPGSGNIVIAGGGDGGFAFKYAFSTTTTGSPTTGTIQFNNATPASATLVYFNETDASGVSIDPIIDNLVPPDWIMFSNADRSKYFVYKLLAPFTSGAGNDNVPVTFQAGTAETFTNGETIYFSRITSNYIDVLGQAILMQKARYYMYY